MPNLISSNNFFHFIFQIMALNYLIICHCLWTVIVTVVIVLFCLLHSNLPFSDYLTLGLGQKQKSKCVCPDFCFFFWHACVRNLLCSLNHSRDITFCTHYSEFKSCHHFVMWMLCFWHVWQVRLKREFLDQNTQSLQIGSKVFLYHQIWYWTFGL